MDRIEMEAALESGSRWQYQVQEAGRRIVELWYGALPIQEENRTAIAASFEEIARVAMSAAYEVRKR